jgi:hypothetical protein
MSDSKVFKLKCHDNLLVTVLQLWSTKKIIEVLLRKYRKFSKPCTIYIHIRSSKTSNKFLYIPVAVNFIGRSLII